MEENQFSFTNLIQSPAPINRTYCNNEFPAVNLQFLCIEEELLEEILIKLYSYQL